MTRFLQSLLTLALIVVVFQIVTSAYVFFSMNRLRDWDPGPELRSKVHSGITWDHWPYQIGLRWRYDSASNTGSMAPFLGIHGVQLPQVPTLEKEDFYLDGNKQHAAIWDVERHPLVFLTDGEFRKAQAIALFFFLIELALTFTIWRHLYHFVRLVGKKEFFDPKNGSRLRIIGWFITALGVFTFTSPYISRWLFDIITGVGPYVSMQLRENSGSLYWVIAGLLLLVIAEAFRKGNQLQTEQEFTI